MMRVSAALCLCLAAHVSGYTPRMFRPGGKYYTPPKYGAGSGGISDSTRQEVSGILKGILDNLMKHKAALPQVAADIVQQFHLESSNADLQNGIRGLYEELGSAKGHGLEHLIADEKQLGAPGSETRKQATAVLASVLEHVESSQETEYTPRMFRPGGKYYVEPKYNTHSGISEGTRQEVSGILKGILENLMKHKAALPQLAKDVVQKYNLGDNSTEQLRDGLQGLYDDLGGNAKSKDAAMVQSSAKNVNEVRAALALVLQSSAAEKYVPGSFSSPYSRPHINRFTGRGRGGLGIDSATKNQVAGILKGILDNLMKHKAALSQVAKDVVQNFQPSAEVSQGLQSAYSNMDGVTELKGATAETKNQVKSVLALVLKSRAGSASKP